MELSVTLFTKFLGRVTRLMLHFGPFFPVNLLLNTCNNTVVSTGAKLPKTVPRKKDKNAELVSFI